MFQPEDVPYHEAQHSEPLEECLALWARADAALNTPSSRDPSPHSEQESQDSQAFAKDLSTRLAHYALSEDSTDSPPASMQTLLESNFSPAADDGATILTAPTRETTSPAPSTAASGSQGKTPNVRFAPLPVPDRGTVPGARETIAEGTIRASATDMAALQEGIRTGKVNVSVGQMGKVVGLGEPQEGERFELVITQKPKKRGILKNWTKRPMRE